MGALALVGTGVALIFGAWGYSNKKKKEAAERARQEQIRINNLLDSITTIQNNMDTLYADIQDNQFLYDNLLNFEIPTLEFNIGQYEEFISDYEGMLAGEDNDLTTQKEINEGLIDQANDAVDTAKDDLSNYIIKSAEQVRQLYQEAFNQVSDARQQEALLNVQAGSSGSVVGSYRTAALKARSDITKFVGADGYLNEGTGEISEGTFSVTMRIARDDIALEKNRLDSAIEAAKLAASQAQLDYENWLDDMEFQSVQAQQQLGAAQLELKQTHEQMEMYLEIIKNKQDTALQLIDDYKAAVSGLKGTNEEISEEEMNEQVSSWKDQFGFNKKTSGLKRMLDLLKQAGRNIESVFNRKLMEKGEYKGAANE